MDLIDIDKLPSRWFNPSGEKNFPGVIRPYVDGHTYTVLQCNYIETYHLFHAPKEPSDLEISGYSRVKEPQ